MTHFFTSDTHFGHASIIKHCTRPFSSIEEMDERLIENWNRTVGPADFVTHLGDFAWKDPHKYVTRLNGHVRLVMGNHDRKGPALRAGFDNVWDVKLVTINNRPMFLFHYPCISWPSKTYKAWHLFGHVHGRLRGKNPRFSLDVGVDSHEYRPISFDEVKLLIENGKSSFDIEPSDLRSDCGTDPRVSGEGGFA